MTQIWTIYSWVGRKISSKFSTVLSQPLEKKNAWKGIFRLLNNLSSGKTKITLSYQPSFWPSKMNKLYHWFTPYFLFLLKILPTLKQRKLDVNLLSNTFFRNSWNSTNLSTTPWVIPLMRLNSSQLWTNKQKCKKKAWTSRVGFRNKMSLALYWQSKVKSCPNFVSSMETLVSITIGQRKTTTTWSYMLLKNFMSSSVSSTLFMKEWSEWNKFWKMKKKLYCSKFFISLA